MFSYFLFSGKSSIVGFRTLLIVPIAIITNGVSILLMDSYLPADFPISKFEGTKSKVVGFLVIIIGLVIFFTAL